MATDITTPLLAAAAEKLLEQKLTITVPVANPAAGTDWSVRVPGGVRWELLGIRWTLTTSAIVANRATQLAVKDIDANELIRFPAPGNIPASTTAFESMLSGYGQQAGAIVAAASLQNPPLLLFNGWSLQTVSSGLDVADQFSSIFVRVRQWSASDVIQAAEMVEEDLQSYMGTHTSSAARKDI